MKQQITMERFNGNFHSITLSHFFNVTLSPPLYYSLKLSTMEWKKRRFFVWMAASTYHLISKDVENHLVIRNSIFRDTSIYKQFTLTKQWNYHIFVEILYSYLRYTVRLLDVFFLLLLAIFLVFLVFLVFLAIRVSLETKKKRLISKKKKYIEEFVEGCHFFGCTFSLLCYCCRFSSTPI